jgi:hypothetical protein
MQRRGKHASITIEELLGNGVFCGPAPRLYNEDPRPAGIRIEGVGSRRWLRRDGKKGIMAVKRRLHVCCEAVINPLPGYD